MTIPTVEESPDLYVNLKIYEDCHFCKIPTKYWHENTNNPLCRSCAKRHKVSELPDYGKRVRANKRKAAKKSRISKEG